MIIVLCINNINNTQKYKYHIKYIYKQYQFVYLSLISFNLIRIKIF